MALYSWSWYLDIQRCMNVDPSLLYLVSFHSPFKVKLLSIPAAPRRLSSSALSVKLVRHWTGRNWARRPRITEAMAGVVDCFLLSQCIIRRMRRNKESYLEICLKRLAAYTKLYASYCVASYLGNVNISFDWQSRSYRTPWPIPCMISTRSVTLSSSLSFPTGGGPTGDLQ